MGWFRHKEDPPYLADLADFSGQVDRLQDGDLLFLQSAWETPQRPGREAALAEAIRLLHDSGRERVAEDLDLGIARWAGAMSRPTAYTSVLATTEIFQAEDIRRETVPAIRDAGLAILLKDLLSSASYKALIEPWRFLTELPPGGEPAGDPEAAEQGTS